MPKIKYILRNFRHATHDLISQANAIIEEYSQKGYALTLRQLYYQFVARGIIPNQQSEYNRLGKVINDARLAGWIDWNAIEDRTRNIRGNSHWESPGQIIEACAEQFKLDRWKAQEYRVEVWIEKDALVGVIEGVCRRLDIAYFSCRGYTSQSEMWRASQRYIKYTEEGQTVRVLHLGDHDPSGIDMTRDIEERLSMFTGGLIQIDRLALNMEQIEELNPPPNPAKLTDSRFQGYALRYGRESWELDALEPEYLEGLIRGKVLHLRDTDEWEKAVEREKEMRGTLEELAEGCQ